MNFWARIIYLGSILWIVNVLYFHKIISVSKEHPQEVKFEYLPTEDSAIPPSTPAPTPPGREVHLSCEAYGGPNIEQAAEMVYWRDLPSDDSFVSPFKQVGPERKFLTFEPDEGGWNNIRMGMETAIALSIAMGRTLVLPPSQGMYLLSKDEKNQKNRFSFTDFFHIDTVAAQHAGLDVMTMEDFLTQEIVTRNLVSPTTGKRLIPPQNRTDWNGVERGAAKTLDRWLRTVGKTAHWDFDQCMVAFSENPNNLDDMGRLVDLISNTEAWQARLNKWDRTRPLPVDAPAGERLMERLGGRSSLCLYSKEFQDAPVVHLMGEQNSGARILVHFYAFLFFQDWKQEQWIKRFVRDHLRYVDEIQCAAARVVSALRDRARQNGQPDGLFDTMHVRRGDFQFQDTQVTAGRIYFHTRDVLVENSTIYIATDEPNRQFFELFRHRFQLYFLSDFEHLLKDVNTNYYGMLEQLIASRGRTFVGCYYSTFTGYINRVRGYHSQKERTKGFEQGILNSYYYIPKDFKLALREYTPLQPPFWAREFPLAWRDLDKGYNTM